ncbi:serine/threonine protein kinase [Amycolatopsis coloradensis]|uniref:non-specific serine/threonine protein kinase n=2 Tax=Amycolatopsis coloradensis TaxID=76021 RepID=A0A1R0KNF5_9PSEU|nr:serine/threonine protein kinase [Amycolatopsis coloradensis]
MSGAVAIDTGQLIAGHYRLVEQIGSGAMGVVWRAIDVRLERSVAVKQILPQPGVSEAERDNMRQRAMREAKNAARFQHPNAIVVFDIAEHGGDPCLVMEYLNGPSLSAIISDEGTLPLGRVAKIGEQVASALVAAHRAGIVHRDVKPGNILIDEAGTAKITDFGISRAAGDMTLTQTGLIGGTPAYLAPELARGSDPVPSSDVFALGATLYQAIEGQTPYGNSSNQLALLYAAANGQINPPQQAGAATALLMSLLRTEPTERPTMAEARERLAALAANESGVGTAASPRLFGAGGGRQPAVPDTPGHGVPGGDRPPWQRTERQAQSSATPPLSPPAKQHTPTAAFIPMRSPAAPPNTPPRPVAAMSPPPSAAAPMRPSPAKSSDGKRKAVLFAGAGAAVVVIAVIVFLVLNSGNGGTGGQSGNNAGANPQTSAPATPSKSASKSSPPPSSAPSNGGKIEYRPAGERVVDFYSNAGSPTGWAMLTPDAQAAYGDQAKYQEYWATHQLSSYKGANATKGNNPDGSVDITINLTFKSGGSEAKTVRVIDGGGGQLLIAGDTRSAQGDQ